jgi:arylsulfatase A-like enzyme
MGLAQHGFDWELDSPHAASIFAAADFATHLFGGQHVTLHPERLGFGQTHRTDAVGQVLATEPSDRRLYIEINFEETHRPYPPPGPKPADLVIPSYLPAGPEAEEEMTAVEGAISQMDAAAGRVLEALERTGRAAHAVVVFTTDHGLAMPRAKCTLYDPGLEVALIVRWPAGDIGSGVARSGLASNLDVLPTLLEAARVDAPESIQGRSLFEPRDAIFAEKTFHSYYDPMRCIRTARHKYIRNFESAFAVEVPADIQQGPIFKKYASRYSTDRPNVVELYDLDADSLEQFNIAGTPMTASIEKELSSRLWAWMRETDDPLLNGPVPSPRYRLAMES